MKKLIKTLIRYVANLFTKKQTPEQMRVTSWSNGNTEAGDFLAQLYVTKDISPRQREDILDKIQVCTTLRGISLSVLYTDICNKDMKSVYNLCKDCPNELLQKACNQQDCTGVEMVKDYL
jgi:hypothetical protein